MVRIYEVMVDPPREDNSDTDGLARVLVQVTDSDGKRVSKSPSLMESMMARGAFRNMAKDQFSEYPVFFVISEGVTLSADALLLMAQLAPSLTTASNDVFCVSPLNDLDRNDAAFQSPGQNLGRILRTDSHSANAFMIATNSVDSLLEQWPKKMWRTLIKNRECLFPEVSHTDLRLSDDQFVVLDMKSPSVADAVSRSGWEASLGRLVKSAVAAPKKATHALQVLPYSAFSKTDMIFKSIASVYDVNDALPPMGSYKGISQFYSPKDPTGRQFVVAVASYSELAPSKTQVKFLSLEDMDQLRGGQSAHSSEYLVALPGALGESCDKVCSAKQFKCEESFGVAINTCEHLKKHFDCRSPEKCDRSIGNDQPAYEEHTKACLVNENTKAYPYKCSASHPKTRRLCACLDEKREREDLAKAADTSKKDFDEYDGFTWLV